MPLKELGVNREPKPKEMVNSFITDATTAYDRNHGPFPDIKSETHTILVEGEVENPLSLSINSLRTEFAQHKVISVLQCAGNRRDAMQRKFKKVNGIIWKDAAVCNCIWSGPLLADVLNKARIKVPVQGAHVVFDCYQTECDDDKYYGGSVSLERCLDVDKQGIIALEMNGHPLTVNHGFPARIVMPGIAGARWTKWLDKIIVQKEESPNYYMQRDYKILPPEVETKEQAEKYWSRVPALQQMPINSVVASPSTGDTIPLSSLPNGELTVTGYAMPQADDGPVINVEVSLDQGKTWEKAEIVYPTKEEREAEGADDKYRWAWVIWKFSVKKERVKQFTEDTKIWSRAGDKGGNLQLGDTKWNYRGIAYNGYGEAEKLKVVDDEGEKANGQS